MPVRSSHVLQQHLIIISSYYSMGGGEKNKRYAIKLKKEMNKKLKEKKDMGHLADVRVELQDLFYPLHQKHNVSICPFAEPSCECSP